MAISAQGIQAWANLWDKMRESRANRPYIDDLAKANRDYAVSQSDISLADALTRDLKNRTDIQHTQALIPYLSAQTGLTNQQSKYYSLKALAEIGLQNAQAALANEETKLYAPKTLADIDLKKVETQTKPISAMGSYLGGIGRLNQSNWATNPNSQLIRTINTPQMQSLIANNPKIAKNVANALANISARANESLDINDDGDALEPVAAPTQIQPINANAPIPLENALSILGTQPQKLKSPLALSDEDIRKLQRASGDALIHKTQTAAQQNQKMYANLLDNLFSSGDSLIPSVAKYAGVAGKYKKQKDRAQAAFGKNSEDYKNYTYFTRSLAPQIANEMRRTLGGQATDYEGKLMSAVADPTYWDSNPELALGQWNMLTQLYKNKINPVLSSTPSQIQQNLAGQSGVNGANEKSTYSAEDIRHTAQKYGITEAEVKRKLGIQ